MRERLPDCRKSWIQKVKIKDATGKPQTFYLGCGEYPDGRLGEIWLDAHKEGTFARGVLSSLARMVSISLQSGVSVQEVVKTLRHLNFPPNGEVIGEFTQVKVCSSIPDWVAQELENHYIKKVPIPSQDQVTLQDPKSTFSGIDPETDRPKFDGSTGLRNTTAIISKESTPGTASQGAD